MSTDVIELSSGRSDVAVQSSALFLVICCVSLHQCASGSQLHRRGRLSIAAHPKHQCCGPVKDRRMLSHQEEDLNSSGMCSEFYFEVQITTVHSDPVLNHSLGPLFPLKL